MLGENHSLLNEFPEFKNLIDELAGSDAAFASEMKKYNALDKEIRKLEMNDSPIDDDSMRELKHERAMMKDALHLQLVQSAK
ncbi:YdcH family protein [Enterovibrio sp. ZSDZ35]|uniref:YdcH family protein n=1 Tax=Enterovibrio qingdaonensis TaxID=2899818 RepID=A0ABT5QSS9_9GAMM|nr:YdcH family protein [Enterovibrio sp. ZSDZ35]MDD1783964.1 YdcH family protein [Enterovibrio sp. ZSDZ35]